MNLLEEAENILNMMASMATGWPNYIILSFLGCFAKM